MKPLQRQDEASTWAWSGKRGAGSGKKESGEWEKKEWEAGIVVRNPKIENFTNFFFKIYILFFYKF
jgi:hypothetical protein